MAGEFGDLSAFAEIPDAHGRLVAALAGHQKLAVGGEGHSCQRLARMVDKMNLLVLARVEQHDRTSATNGNKRTNTIIE